MRTKLLGLAALLLGAPALLAADVAVDYQRDIKPILAKNCASCHNSNKAKGKLAVDTVAAMLKGGSNGPAVVPGKSKDSLLIHSFTGGGDAPKMPPKGRGLSNEEIELVKKWVDAGAKGPADEKPEAVAANKKGDDDDKRGERKGKRRGRMRRDDRKKEEDRKKDGDRKKREKDDD